MKIPLNNKKGIFGINLDGIGSAIQGIIQIIPKPILFILFLFLLATIAYALSIVFNAFGIYCNSANTPVQVHGGIFSGLTLIGSTPDPELIGSAVIEDADNYQDTTMECIYHVTNANITYSDGTKETLFDRYVYIDQGCIICQKSGNIYLNTLGVDIPTKYCADEHIIAKPDGNKTWLQRTTCGQQFLGRCQPPEHYYFDSNHPENYICLDETCQSITAGRVWDELLQSKGAIPLYQSTDINPAHDSVFGITCTELNPKLAVWGADVFNYTTVFVVALLISLIWLYFLIK